MKKKSKLIIVRYQVGVNCYGGPVYATHYIEETKAPGKPKGLLKLS